jgi:hypothetical protein
LIVAALLLLADRDTGDTRGEYAGLIRGHVSSEKIRQRQFWQLCGQN